MYCGGLAENIYLLTFYVYLFLIFFVIEILCQTKCFKEPEKFNVIYYLIFVKNKSEFLLVLYSKFDMNT